MRFWDSSVLVNLCVVAPRTLEAQKHYIEDPRIVAWWGSEVECASAIARREREGAFGDAGAGEAWAVLAALGSVWVEVQPSNAVRRQAVRVVRLHPLRAGDALQLAAAIEWAGSPPSGELVTFDARLREAARLEGFTVLPAH